MSIKPHYTDKAINSPSCNGQLREYLVQEDLKNSMPNLHQLTKIQLLAQEFVYQKRGKISKVAATLTKDYLLDKCKNLPLFSLIVSNIEPALEPSYEKILQDQHRNIPIEVRKIYAIELSKLSESNPEKFNQFAAEDPVSRNRRFSILFEGSKYSHEETPIGRAFKSISSDYFSHLSPNEVDQLIKMGSHLREKGEKASFNWKTFAQQVHFSKVIELSLSLTRLDFIPQILKIKQQLQTPLQSSDTKALSKRKKDLEIVNHFLNEDKDDPECLQMMKKRFPQLIKMRNVLNQIKSHSSAFYSLSQSVGVRIPKKLEKGATGAILMGEMAYGIFSIAKQGVGGLVNLIDPLTSFISLFTRKKQSSPFEPILQNLKIIDEKIDRNYGAIVEVLNNVHLIQRGLVELSQQVIIQHFQILEHLEKIGQGIGQIQQLARIPIYLTAAQLYECEKELVEHPDFLPGRNRLATYQHLQRYYDQNGLYISEGLHALSQLFRNTGFAEGAFHLHLNLNDGNPNVYFKGREDLSKQSLYFSQVLWMFTATQRSSFSTFFLQNPSLNVKELEEKISDPSERLETFIPSFTLGEVQPLYSLPILESLINWAVRFHYFYDLIDTKDSSRLMPLKEIAQNLESTLSQKGKKLLESGLKRIDILIAQFTLISGDFLLPIVFQLMKEGKRKEALPILINNPTLTHNLMIYSFHKSLQKREGGPLIYHMAYHSSENLHLLTQLLEPIWDFQWNPEEKKWGVLLKEKGFKEVWAPLPSPLQVSRGEFQFPIGWRAVLQLKERVLRELSNYSFPPFLTNQEDRKTYLLGLVLPTLISNQGNQNVKPIKKLPSKL